MLELKSGTTPSEASIASCSRSILSYAAGASASQSVAQSSAAKTTEKPGGRNLRATAVPMRQSASKTPSLAAGAMAPDSVDADADVALRYGARACSTLMTRSITRASSCEMTKRILPQATS